MSRLVFPSLMMNPLPRLWAIFPFLAMGSLFLRAEGPPVDTRVRQLHIERSQHSALPANVSFADVIGSDIEVFDNDEKTHKEGTHAFFIKLGDKTALALGYERQFGGKGPSEIQFKGQMVKLGPLLRSPPNAAHSMMWVWEAELPPGAVPLVREQLALPLILYMDAMTILTAEGPKQAELIKMHPGQPILPGHAINDSATIKLDDADSYTAIRVGDPVIQTSTGIVVAAVRSKDPWTASMKEPADCGIVWLSFPRPPERLAAPLEEVWGASVPSDPSLDEAFVQKLMPARALGTKIGEKIEDAWERNPLLHRLPPESKNRWFSEDYFGQEWVFPNQAIATEDGHVVSIDYKTACSIGSKTTMVFVNWLAEKFQNPKEVRKTPRGDDLLAIWNQGPIWVAAMFSLRDKTISLDMFVSGSETKLKDRFNEDSFSVPAAADKNTFLSLTTALASRAMQDDYGVTEKSPFSNPAMMAGTAKPVSAPTIEEVRQEAPTKPVTAQKTEETQADAPTQPAPSVNKVEIRRMAVQKIEALGRVVQAYNDMPETVRKEANVQTVGGAYGLLRSHAERYPELVLNDDLRRTMAWALVFLDTGKLQGSPALQKLVQVINAEIALENAQRTAQQAATVFAAAKAAGTKGLDSVKTVEDAIQRLNAGVKGTGASKAKVFAIKSTPELAAQAGLHLRYDADHKTLRYIPKSVKLEGSDVPLNGIQELAQLIEQKDEDVQTVPTATASGSSFKFPDTEAERKALILCWVYNAAMATGTTELDNVKTVDELIQLLKKGVDGGGIYFSLRMTLDEALAARPFLKLDLNKKLLLYHSDSMSADVRSTNLIFEGTGAATERKAYALASSFNSAVATGSKELNDVKTVEEAIKRLNTGVFGGGDFSRKRIYTKTTPQEALAVRPFLKLDTAKKSLHYNGGSRDAGLTFLLNPPRPKPQLPQSASEIAAAQAQRTAQKLALAYDAAVAAGSKDIDQLQSLDAVINRLTTTGMIGGPGPYEGKRIYTKTKPGETEAAKPYLRYDSFTKTLHYSSAAISSRSSSTASAANETRSTVIHSGSEAPRASSNLNRASGVPSNSDEKLAAFFATAFNVAVSTGSKELDDVRSVDAAMSRMVAGVYGGGVYKDKRFIVKATPAEVAAARRYLTFIPTEKNLRFTSMGGSRGSGTASAANETRPTVMNVGRAVGGGVTFAGRTFANVAEMEQAIRESQAAAKQALAVRNAQSFVATYNAAMAAGAKELNDVRTVDQALKRIMAGVNGGGPFKGRFFVLDATPEEAASVRPYIEFDPRQQTLVYKSPYR